MKFDKTFSIISRINQTLLFIGLLSVLGFAIWGAVMIYHDSHQPRTGEVTINASKDEGSGKKIIDIRGFRKIGDTGFLMSDICERDPSNHKLYASTKTTNVMFISSKENKAHLLFPHANYLINETSVLTLGDGFLKDTKNSVKGLLCEYVKDDTNKNNTLDDHDALSVGLARADGTGLVEVLSNVDSLLSQDVLDEDTLSLIYQKGNKVSSARYSLKTFKLLSTTVITDLLAVATHG